MKTDWKNSEISNNFKTGFNQFIPLLVIPINPQPSSWPMSKSVKNLVHLVRPSRCEEKDLEGPRPSPGHM